MDKRSLTIGRHRTSVALEPAFWEALGEIAAARGLAISQLIAEIDRTRAPGGLASALRVYVLDHYRRPAGSDAPASA
ncbi:ribbon-helix-helix domain-containing protein [Segnochrobactrum spirostomi]|uniref:Ribbon-helix-helix domain-containing protein n=1 Tax=Segnochrobactrum spirostomi TaxID=2608987 RepID=A0A6A7Y041_9HYPH|nr:ribbon-helix-helix domain-containing protein [Segnochrobactrum spirostomi]MQT11531.1 ribbon-helix-helix domain-containing protein [Segnochrobactrum spirostomi]